MTTYTAINLIARPQGGPIGPALFDVVQKIYILIKNIQKYF